MLEKKLHTRV